MTIFYILFLLNVLLGAAVLTAINKLKVLSLSLAVQYLIDTSFFFHASQESKKRLWKIYIGYMLSATIVSSFFFLVCYLLYMAWLNRLLDIEQAFLNLYILSLFALPILVFLFLLPPAIGKSLCSVCKGSKVLNGNISYLNTDFQQDTCFCCIGKGRIKNNSPVGNVHHLLRKNHEAIEVSSRLKNTHQKELRHYQRELEKEESAVIRKEIEGVIQRLQQEVDYHDAVLKFHHTCAKKSSALIYNNYLLTLIDRTNQCLNRLEGEQTAHYADATIAQWEATQELAFSQKAQELMMRLNQTSSISITEELQAEIEKLI